MKKAIKIRVILIWNVLLFLVTQFTYSQNTHSLIDTSLLDVTVKYDSTVLMNVLRVENRDLGNIISGDILYLKENFRKHFKNITVQIQTHSSKKYLVITTNLPDFYICNNEYLFGFIEFEGYKIFVYEETGSSPCEYFSFVEKKYQNIGCDNNIIMTLNTPIWSYTSLDGALKEVYTNIQTRRRVR